MKISFFLTLIFALAIRASSQDGPRGEIRDLLETHKLTEIPSTVLHVLNEDVVILSGQEKKYDTLLKRANFRKTEEYKEHHKNVAKTKADLLQMNWYAVIVNAEIQPYDLKKKGFIIYLSRYECRNSKFFGQRPCEPDLRINDSIVFSNLHVKSTVNDGAWMNVATWIFIPVMDSEVAEKIESDTPRGARGSPVSGTRVYLLFSLLGTTNSTDGKQTHTTEPETTDKYIYARLSEIVLAGSDGSIYHRYPVADRRIGKNIKRKHRGKKVPAK